MVVCIAGMHRSGTSMVARLLHDCGLWLGEQADLIPAAADNSEGFWENRHFTLLNDELLSLLHGGWDVVPAVEKNWPARPELADVRARAIALIAGMSEHQPWGWKDPRSSITLAFWQALLPSLKLVICLRNPIEVARSLENRNHTSEQFGLNLWTQYNRVLLEQVPPERRVVTHYEAYFKDAPAELRRVCDAVGVNVSQETIAQACRGAVPNLRHNRVPMSRLLEPTTPPSVVRLYAQLCAEAGPVFAGVEASHVPEVQDDHEGIPAHQDDQWIARAVDAERAAKTAMLEAAAAIGQRDQLLQRIETAEQRFAEERGHLQLRLDGAQRHIADLTDQITAIRQSLTWRIIGAGAALASCVLPGRKPDPQALPRWARRRKSSPVSSEPVLPSRNPLTLARQVISVWRSEGFSAVLQAVRRRRKYVAVLRDPAAFIQEVTAPPRISIVIPVFNNLNLTRDCVRSILNASGAGDFEIVIVDNASSDGTDQWLQQISAAEPPVRFIRNEKNLGFAGAVNVGANAARGRYVVILNNDTLVSSQWLDRLISAAESDPAIGIVSPMTNYVGEGPQLAKEFADMGPSDVAKAVNELAARAQGVRPVVDRLVFFCVLIKRDLWDLIGGLSGVYGLGNYEDDDFCLRARLAGYKLAVATDAFVFHYGSQTFKKQNISHMQLMEKNRAIYLERMAELSMRAPQPRTPASSTVPFASIIVRTVDRANLLRLALRSLANQTFSDFEVVVINDAGPDIGALLKEFEPYLRLRYIRHEKPLGRTAALNRGIGESRGQWLGYLDDDDILYPLHLEVLADLARRQQGALVVYADAVRALAHADEAEDTIICRLPAAPFDFDPQALLVENKFPIQSVLHSRKCFDLIGTFNESIDLLEDWDFWLRLSQATWFYRAASLTSEYRFRVCEQLRNSITSRRREALEAMERTYQRHSSTSPQIQQKRQMLLESMRLQIADLEKINGSLHDDRRKAYLTICRVAGFSPDQVMWTGYRA